MCKCFLNFLPLFSKYIFFEVATFFSFSTHLVKSIFSVVVRICKIFVIDETFFLFIATIRKKSEKLPISCFLVNHWSKFLSHNYAAYQSKLWLKNRVKESFIYDVHKKWLIFWPPYPHHLQKWTIDLFFKNNRIHKHVTNFKTPPPPFVWTS